MEGASSVLEEVGQDVGREDGQRKLIGTTSEVEDAKSGKEGVLGVILCGNPEIQGVGLRRILVGWTLEGGSAEPLAPDPQLFQIGAILSGGLVPEEVEGIAGDGQRGEFVSSHLEKAGMVTIKFQRESPTFNKYLQSRKNF